MRDDGDGCTDVVQRRVRDRADVHAERVVPDAAPDDQQGRTV